MITGLMPTTPSPVSLSVFRGTITAALGVMVITSLAPFEQTNVEGQTVSSSTSPVMVLNGEGKGTVKCRSVDNGDNSTSPSSTSAQITFTAFGHQRGTFADIIGGGTVRLYSTDIGTAGGANVSMEGSSGPGSIYSGGFAFQIGKAAIKCTLYSTEGSSLFSPTGSTNSLISNQSGAYYNKDQVLITGKCGSGAQIFANDIAGPFKVEGSFKGDVKCITSNVKINDICSTRTGRDSDGDGIDDICDPIPFPDLDGDGIGDQRYEIDNCPSVYNPDQSDRDRNGIGDVCDLHPPGLMDPDKDFVGDRPGEIDNCPDTYNPDQKDIDHDGIGEACDPHPSTAPVYPGQKPLIQSREPEQSFPDRDHDNIPDNPDDCIDIRNADQKDFDRDKKGDACDNCRNVYNPEQVDRDRDRIGDTCDDAPNIPNPRSTS
jgi:hypothetical protein